MTVGETLELIAQTREFLVEDFEEVRNQSNPTNKELLKHIKECYKEGDLDEMLEEVLLEYDFDNAEEDYKILLLVSAAISKQ